MKSSANPNLFVITGGPGSGKTALLRELERLGCACVAEDARALIQEQAACGGDALPWRNVPLYAETMLRRSIATYRVHTNAVQPTFFDRGVLDAVGYAWLIGVTLDESLLAEALGCDYNRTAIIAPPWLEIYATDAQRTQSFEEACTTYATLRTVYADHGYRLLELPCADAAARAHWVLSVAHTVLACPTRSLAAVRRSRTDRMRYSH